jgi:uncharacterized membrane protein
VTFAAAMDRVAEVFEVIGAVVLFLGLLVSVGLAARALRSSVGGRAAYRVLRQSFGGVILLGLEILVAADLVRTVAVAPTLESVFILGIIVVIRTVLSFSLETEIEGVAPWRRAATTGAEHIVRAAVRSTARQPPGKATDRDPF